MLRMVRKQRVAESSTVSKGCGLGREVGPCMLVHLVICGLASM